MLVTLPITPLMRQWVLVWDMLLNTSSVNQELLCLGTRATHRGLFELTSTTGVAEATPFTHQKVDPHPPLAPFTPPPYLHGCALLAGRPRAPHPRAGRIVRGQQDVAAHHAPQVHHHLLAQLASLSVPSV